MFCKIGVLKNFTKFRGKRLCFFLSCRPCSISIPPENVKKLKVFWCFASVYKWNKACSFIKKEALAQVFYCEFCEIFKNTYFFRTPLVASSVVITCCFFSTFTLARMYCRKFIVPVFTLCLLEDCLSCLRNPCKCLCKIA